MRMNGEYPLTVEQNSAVDLFATGGSLKVDARAGAGKTSTLVAMAKEEPLSGITLVVSLLILTIGLPMFGL